MRDNDTYTTIEKPAEAVILKEKNSRFIGYAFPVNDRSEINKCLETVKKQHSSARHWCYAWQLGTNDSTESRTNDDGEPRNSAGAPIYGQIQSAKLTNILIVVVRYFGGVKLGVGGLIKAYRTSAKYAVEASVPIKKYVETSIQITFKYPNLSAVMRLIKENNVKIVSQNMKEKCYMELRIRNHQLKQVIGQLESIYGVMIVKKQI
ncbi:IMPACT family protein [Ascidiimonas aurantiaca]|uniref:IMPACT family protein n=1 Tax=Ascidiimonas aurantiaca TaxID=1685432 RepID=UPI0030EDC0AE